MASVSTFGEVIQLIQLVGTAVTIIALVITAKLLFTGFRQELEQLAETVGQLQETVASLSTQLAVLQATVPKKGEICEWCPLKTGSTFQRSTPLGHQSEGTQAP